MNQKSLNPRSYIFNSDRRGIAALVTIMTVMLFLVSVAFLIANLSQSSISGGQNESYGTEAQFLAEAGIQDALIRLARDSSSTDSFTITNGSSSVVVAITTGSPVVVIATSTVSGPAITVSRTIRADVTIDPDGKITAVSKTNL